MNGLIAIALALAIAPLASAQNAAETVVAQVGTKKITLEDFNKKFAEVKGSLNPPTKNQFLEDLVRYEVGVQEAEKRHLDKDPIVRDLMNQEMYKSLLEKDIGQKVQKLPVSDAEMQAWYKQNPELRTSHILIEFKPGATPQQIGEARKRAEEIYDEVKKSKRPFEELVHLYSDDTATKQTGGDVGWQSRMSVVPSYYDAALAMKIGDVKGLIETPYGFHIIKLTGRHSFDEANRKQIRLAVFDEKRKQVFNTYFDALKKRYSIKTNPGAL